jgi:hypothetical protein
MDIVDVIFAIGVIYAGVVSVFLLLGFAEQLILYWRSKR